VGEFSEGGGRGGGGSKGKRNTEVERLQQQWGEKEEEEVVHIGSKGQDKIVATIQMQGVKKSVKAAVGWQQTVRFFLFCSIAHTRHTSSLSLSLSLSLSVFLSLSHTHTHSLVIRECGKRRVGSLLPYTHAKTPLFPYIHDTIAPIDTFADRHLCT